MLLRSDVGVNVGSVRDKPPLFTATKPWRSASLFTNGVPDARKSRDWGKWNERGRGYGRWRAVGCDARRTGGGAGGIARASGLIRSIKRCQWDWSYIISCCIDSRKGFCLYVIDPKLRRMIWCNLTRLDGS